MVAGQLLLQSFYEDRERTMRLGGLHHARPGSSGRGVPALGSPWLVPRFHIATLMSSIFGCHQSLESLHLTSAAQNL